MFTHTRIKAEMARQGLLTNQLQPYENPDTESMMYPMRDPETIAAAWRFLGWLERELG